MVSERYGANAAALGEDAVKKFNSMCVAIYGGGPVAQSAIYSLIGLGVGSIEHIVESDALNAGIIRNLADSISPHPQRFGESLFFIAPQLNYSQQKKPIRSKIALNTLGLEYEICKNNDDCGEIINSEQPCSQNVYGQVKSLFAGALFADEVRKRACHVSKYELQLQNGDSIDVNVAALLHKSAKKSEPAKLNRVLVIGAGGLGTYCTYVLANRGVDEIILCEPDFVEETNLNRQLFYTGRVGDKKANVLAQRLSNKKTKITARTEYFTSKFDAGGKLDAIFCCTDNFESRIAASDYACENLTPLVEGGCTTTSGSVTTYIPHKTKSVSEQRDLHALLNLQLEAKSELAVPASITSCVKVANPSIISPNVLIGGLQAIALDRKYDNSDAVIEQYPQLFLNLLRYPKFSQSNFSQSCLSQSCGGI